MRFVYSLIRFVPDPARGEFINVGALVGSEESSEWEIRQIENPVRARALGEPRALDAVWSFIDRIGNQIDEYQAGLESLFDPAIELSESWLEELHRDHQNVVQLSAPAPMLAATADEALERVFDLMVIDPAQRRYKFRKKNEAIAAVRRAYKALSLRQNQDLRERVTLSTRHHHERFDFAITNGHVLQLTQAWSFQVPDQDSLSEQIKAWGWTVNEARGGGGEIALRDGTTFQVASDVDVEVVYVPPEPGHESRALDEARNVFDSLQIIAVPLDRADQDAARALALLREVGVGQIDFGH